MNHVLALRLDTEHFSFSIFKMGFLNEGQMTEFDVVHLSLERTLTDSFKASIQFIAVI